MERLLFSLMTLREKLQATASAGAGDARCWTIGAAVQILALVLAMSQ